MTKGLMKIKEFTRYSISKCGKITNLSTGQIVSEFKRNGYPSVALSSDGTRINQKIRYVHRLLALAFIPNKNNYRIVNHRNGVKEDYRLTNLEWCTYSINNKHAYKTGLNIPNTGTKSHASKLTTSQVLEIKTYLANGKSQQKIADMYNVSRGCIQSIKEGKTWKEV